MSKKELNPEERKVKFSISLSPVLFDIVDKTLTNKSKYIENLILSDLIKQKKITKNTLI